MTFEKINILPNDKSTWRIHKGFEIILGTNLGFFKWKYNGQLSTDMKLFDAISTANLYAEELNLVERINKESKEIVSNSPLFLLSKFLSDDKNACHWTGKTPATMYWKQLNIDAAKRFLSLDVFRQRRCAVNDEYDMSILKYLANLGYIMINPINEVKLTSAGVFLYNTYSK